MTAIPIDPTTRLLVLTGAGVSAESGLDTFRGNGGMWEGMRAQDVATPEAFGLDPAKVWRFYSARRKAALAAAPNAAHIALARAGERMGERMLLVTQNVDGLHERAGQRNVVRLHGSLWVTRCSRCTHSRHDIEAYEGVPLCAKCGSAERPDIVWFGEMLDPDGDEAIWRFMHQQSGDLKFLAIGTSGVVYPAAAYVEFAKANGAETWLANLEGGAANVRSFDHVVTGPAATTVPLLLGQA